MSSKKETGLQLQPTFILVADLMVIRKRKRASINAERKSGLKIIDRGPDLFATYGGKNKVAKKTCNKYIIRL